MKQFITPPNVVVPLRCFMHLNTAPFFFISMQVGHVRRDQPQIKMLKKRKFQELGSERSRIILKRGMFSGDHQEDGAAQESDLSLSLSLSSRHGCTTSSSVNSEALCAPSRVGRKSYDNVVNNLNLDLSISM